MCIAFCACWLVHLLNDGSFKIWIYLWVVEKGMILTTVEQNLTHCCVGERNVRNYWQSMGRETSVGVGEL